MNKETYQKAYDQLTISIQEKPKVVKNYFERALIDFHFLQNNYNNTISDLEFVLKHHPKDPGQILLIMAIMSDWNNFYNEVILYGERALKAGCDHSEWFLELNFALARAFFVCRDCTDDYIKALNYINQTIEIMKKINQIASENGDNQSYDINFEINLRMCKIDICFCLDAYSIIEEELNIIMPYAHNYHLYYYHKSRMIINSNPDDADKLREALDNVNIFLNYDEHRNEGLLLKAHILRLLKKEDEADQICLNQIDLTDENYVSDVIKNLYLGSKFELAEEIAKKFLESTDSWKVRYGYASLYFDQVKTTQELEQCLAILGKDHFEHEPITNLYFLVINRLRRYPEAEEFLIEQIKAHHNPGKWWYYLAEITLKNNNPYDAALSAYLMSYQYGFLTEIEYLESILPIVVNPQRYYRKYRRLVKKFLNDYYQHNQFPSTTLLRIASAVTNGSYGLKQDVKLALDLINDCVKSYPDDCCTLCLAGTINQLLKNTQESDRYYQKAYELNRKTLPICYCGYGFKAHQLLTNSDDFEDEAMRLILEAIKMDHGKSDSSIVYLYAYFTIKGKPGFDRLTAIKYLTLTSVLTRYEITKYVYLIKLTDDLNQIKKYQKMLKKALKYDSLQSRIYYQQHHLDQYFYPFFNHF